MKQTHIGVIYTGGTIGMEKTAHGYAPLRNFSKVLESLLQDKSHSLPRYTLHTYATPIDSTNATPHDWQAIGRDIAALYADYDGFVVLHGTDTMAYTAAALSYMLQGLRKPVIVTGAQIPLCEAGSDGLQNLMHALQIAASGSVCEVAIYFAHRLLRGNRAVKVSAARMAAFDSPNYPWLAEVGTDIQWNRAALLPMAGREKFALPDFGAATVLPLRCVPGLPVQAVQALLALQPQAMILQGYGAGNVPDRDPALLKLLADAHEQGVVTVVCTQCLHGGVAMGAYAVSAGLGAAGVIGAQDMTFEAIYAKLHYLFALGLRADAARTAFLQNLSGELTA